MMIAVRNKFDTKKKKGGWNRVKDDGACLRDNRKSFDK